MERYKPVLKEAKSVDITYIYKRLKDYKKGIISENNCIDGILLDLRKKGDKKAEEIITDHVENSIDETRNDTDLKKLAIEIYHLIYRGF